MSDDPYTIQPGGTREPPRTFVGRLKSLGPGIVVSGSIVGSGEILLTAGLGAAAGFTLLWWVLFSCWIKSLIQAEIGRFVLTSGDTYLRALNRMPGRIRLPDRQDGEPRDPISWPIWLGLVGFVPGLLTSGGIIGGAGQALNLILEPLGVNLGGGWATIMAAALVMLLLWTGKYKRIESILIPMVMSFALATIVCALLMQGTEYRASFDDILIGLQFDFPVEYIVLAIGMYGATGVASGEIAAYTYWCVEKGYPNYIGGDRSDPGWVDRAKGWIRVMQMDVWVTLVILTFATLAFYFLGAGVLHRMGVMPEGTETVFVLANMYTSTLGAWGYWLFLFAAFFILFSTSLSGLGAGSRSFPDLLVTLGFIRRRNLTLRRKWITGYVIVMPMVSASIYFGVQAPIPLVIFGATFGAFMLPVQAFVTLYMQRTRMDPRVRPRMWVSWCIGATFAAMSVLCAWYIYVTLFG